jgi:beta-phosphoglucomutase-like phosphatase (HAD superfamily)
MGAEPRAFLFDLDGTLIDSEPMWAEALDRSLQERDIVLGKSELDALVYGRSWLDIYDDLTRRFPGRCGTREVLEGRIDVHFDELKWAGDVRIESSIELLKRLAIDHPVAVVSGSGRRMVGEWLKELGLGEKLQFFLGCEDYPAGKPDPACYRAAAARLGVDPSACVVFEDSRAGVLAAKAAGMTCIALARPGKRGQDLSAADRILTDLSRYAPPFPAEDRRSSP